MKTRSGKEIELPTDSANQDHRIRSATIGPWIREFAFTLPLTWWSVMPSICFWRNFAMWRKLLVSTG